MTQENKQLLLQDLSARLPYGVKVKTNNINVLKLGTHTRVGEYVTDVVEPCKPYLFPLSSMTEGQKKEFKEISKYEYEIKDYGGFDSSGVYLIEIGKYEYEYDIDTTVEEFYFNYEILDWLNKNHFDYRGLIEKGLALNATGLNIYNI